VKTPSNQAEIAKTELFDFKGEKVLISATFPKELFNQSTQDFEAYYNKLSGSDNTRNSGEKKIISLDELHEVLRNSLKKYPQVNFDQDISETDLKQIYKDFPGITTKEQALSKIELIFEYYNTLCKNDVANAVVKIENFTNANGRVNGPSPDNLSTPERNHLLSNPVYAVNYTQAAKDAMQFESMYAISYFGGATGKQDQINAFLHSTWNALSIRYILKGAPSSEDQAIDFTQDGTSKHEQDNSGNQIRNDQSAMDLFNNMAARSWMKDETKWGVGPLRKMPSTEDIVNTMASKANASSLSTRAQILAPHGGDTDNVWNKLYELHNGSQQYLVRLD
jgi:hypothetical protein